MVFERPLERLNLNKKSALKIKRKSGCLEAKYNKMRDDTRLLNTSISANSKQNAQIHIYEYIMVQYSSTDPIDM